MRWLVEVFAGHWSPRIPLPWIPAFAGMTNWEAGMTHWGEGMAQWAAGSTIAFGGNLNTYAEATVGR